MAKPNVTVRDLAAAAGLSRRQVWRHVKRGRLPKPQRVAGKAVWRKEQTRSWLAWRRGRPLCRDLAKALTTIDPSCFFRPGLPELITVEELVAMLSSNGLKVSERTIWRWVANGEMPGPEPGKLRPRLWRRATVMAWWAEKRQAMGLPPLKQLAPDAFRGVAVGWADS